MNEAQCARTMQIIDAHGRDPAALIAILQDVQAANSYLSQENLELIAKELNVSQQAASGLIRRTLVMIRKYMNVNPDDVKRNRNKK